MHLLSTNNLDFSKFSSERYTIFTIREDYFILRKRFRVNNFVTKTVSKIELIFWRKVKFSDFGDFGIREF